MEFLIHHLIARYVVNLPALGCVVLGVFSVGVAAFFLPLNTPSNVLLVLIIPFAGFYAALLELLRIRARVFVRVPLS
jgi:hypothetical protein